ncbi:hypothetical protein [Micromonospora sp. DT233]|uniref:hypothetical protein n=1 Tax=Micromonospora sp. DT233 TaxID=3393432 RepID=UPI003CE9F8F5
MQRRIVAVVPLLACVLLLHLGLTCRPPLATALPGPAATSTRADPPAPAARTAVAPPAGVESRPARTHPVRLEAHRRVDALAPSTGQPPQRSVVAGLAGKAYASVTRCGRSNPTTDRRNPVAQEAAAPPDAPLRRENAADGRPLTAPASPDPLRSSILRC